MIIRQLRLYPFAGISDRSIVLRPGLNVILGPNEAGKSTVVSALRSVLFESTDYGKVLWRKSLERFVPLGGGDTFRVMLDFESRGASFRLAKSWGNEKRSELMLPGGQIVTSPAEVQSQMAQQLGLRQGTWENVLFTRQAQLPNTNETLHPECEEARDLGQLLRRAVLATDGVAIEKLGELIKNRLAAAMSRWDQELQRPEGNRGIDNRWSRGVGIVLQVWYHREEIREEREKTEQFERQLDQLTVKINQLVVELNALQQFVDLRSAIAADAEQRNILSLKQQTLHREHDALKAVSREWPQLIERKSQQGINLKSETVRLEALEDELTAAKNYGENRDKRAKLDAARQKAGELSNSRAILNGKRGVTKAQIDEVDRLERQRKELEAGLSGGKLKLEFQAFHPLQVRVQKDLDEVCDTQIPVETPLIVQAGGRISVEHSDWTMVVESGDVGFQDLERKHADTVKKLRDLLETLSVDSPEQAQTVRQDYVKAEQDVAALEKRLAEILDGTTIEALMEALGTEAETTLPRPLDVIAGELGKLKAECKQIESAIKDTDGRLTLWDQQHESWDSLQETLFGKLGELKEIESKISSLRPLPDDVTDVEAFLAEFHEKKDRLQAIKESELSDLKLKRAELEKDTPARSLLDIDEALLDAERSFDRAGTEAKSLTRVHELYKRLRQQLDSGTQTPWIESMRRLVGALTGGRYEQVTVETWHASRTNAAEVPFDLLSVGTQACLGLAIRLSMASHFLEDRSGFLLLDDPLVDLDPNRQTATARVLRDFADAKQVIVLTCHPRHAELFGVEPIIVEQLS